MKHKFRIVTDNHRGYEAQVKFWWFPVFWWQMGYGGLGTNTWESMEDAEKFIKRWKCGRAKFVKYVD